MAVYNGKYNQGKCLSKNLYTLIEWCLNTKEDISFDWLGSENKYSIKVSYMDSASGGQYLDTEYDIRLQASITDEQGKTTYTTIAVSDEWNLNNAIYEFNLILEEYD
jgi:hypothetical protein